MDEEGNVDDGRSESLSGVERWRASTRAKAVAASAERREAFVTTSEIPVHDVYVAEDLAGRDLDADLGLPGEYPFTRGVQATMYRSRFWTMRQYAGFATADRDQRAVPVSPRAGPDRPVGGIRPPDANGL